MYEKIDSYIEKLLNNSTPDAPLWNIESIRQGKKPHWNYIDGCRTHRLSTACWASTGRMPAGKRRKN